MRFDCKTVVVISVSAEAGKDAPAPEHWGRDIHMGVMCAREFAAHGARVVAIDPSQQALDALEAEISASGGHISAIRAELDDPAELRRAAEVCESRFGVVDVLLTCHTDLEWASVEDSSIESWSRVVNFNLLGPVLATKAFLPLLKRSGGAAIVHFGSIDGNFGNPKVPSYSAAKGGLVPLTHVMAEEFARYGIRVNCVARGMTQEQGATLNPMYEPLVAQTPIARPAYPHEVGAAARFLASAEASYITGAVLPVDGGRTCITPGTRSMR